MATADHKNIAFTTSYTKALSLQAVKENLAKPHERMDLREVETYRYSRYTQSALELLIVFDRVILTGFETPDLEFLKDDDILLGEPENEFTALGHEGGYSFTGASSEDIAVKQSWEDAPGLADEHSRKLAEYGLFNEYFIVNNFWSRARNSRKRDGDATGYDLLGRVPYQVRLYLWRIFCWSFGKLNATELPDIERAKLLASFRWVQKKSERWEALHKALHIDFLVYGMMSIVEQKQYAALANTSSACMLYDRRLVHFPATTREMSPASAGRYEDALAAIRLALATYPAFPGRQLTIGDVLKMRKLPEVRGLRDSINAIISGAVQEDDNYIIQAGKELAKARKHLRRAHSLDILSRATTYLSIPISGIEFLLGLPPIAGLTIAGTGVIATAGGSEIKKRYGWVTVLGQ